MGFWGFGVDEFYERDLIWLPKEWPPFHAPDIGRLSHLLPEELLREESFLQLEWGSELWMVVIPVPLVVCIFNTATLTTDADWIVLAIDTLCLAFIWFQTLFGWCLSLFCLFVLFQPVVPPFGQSAPCTFISYRILLLLLFLYPLTTSLTRCINFLLHWFHHI